MKNNPPMRFESIDIDIDIDIDIQASTWLRAA